jgi:hypothetical protein
VELHLYKSESSGLIIKVNPKNLKPFYKLTQQAKYFLRERPLPSTKAKLEQNVEDRLSPAVK